MPEGGCPSKLLPSTRRLWRKTVEQGCSTLVQQSHAIWPMAVGWEIWWLGPALWAKVAQQYQGHPFRLVQAAPPQPCTSGSGLGCSALLPTPCPDWDRAARCPPGQMDWWAQPCGWIWLLPCWLHVHRLSPLAGSGLSWHHPGLTIPVIFSRSSSRC